LAKQLIATGIALFGDRPLGWRFTSVLAGSTSLLVFYLLGGGLAWAWGFSGFLLFLHARLAMLDPHMMGFLLLALFFLVRFLREPRASLSDWFLAMALMGLASASKWAALFPWAFLGVAIVLWSVWRYRDAKFTAYLLLGGVVGFGAYFTTFLPHLNWSQDAPSFSQGLFQAQVTMLDGQKRVVTPHSYMSQWYQWPWLLRPMWYIYDRISGTELVNGIFAVANPLQAWLGTPLVVWTLYFLTRRGLQKGRLPLLPTLWTSLYLVLTFCWVLVPRKVSFFYYSFPAFTLLSLLWAWWHSYTIELRSKWRYVFHSALGASLALFVYFYPVLSAYPISARNFRAWAWFSSWI
jgi:dolichyl-phosphate-mannose--protein O-mannosyl transferase